MLNVSGRRLGESYCSQSLRIPWAGMSLGHSLTSTFFPPLSKRGPWQFRARPVLVMAVGSVVAVLLMVGLLVVARRLSGALITDLPPDAMLLTALAVGATLTSTRIAWRRSFPLETSADLSFADLLLGWSSSAATGLLAIGCCYPANRTTDWLIWLPILVADQFWRQNFFDTGEPWLLAGEDGERDLIERPTCVTPPPADASQHGNILQQLYRLRDEQEGEVIYGTVRADFAAGQRTAVVHVGFCPPLTQLPEIEAEALPGSAAKVKVVQAFAHGTRLDVRLPAPAQLDCQVWIDMAARPVRANAGLKFA